MQMETSVPVKSLFIEGDKNEVAAVELKKTFPVSIERLYDCWTNPKLFAQWWKGLIVKEMSASQGGSYRFEWEGVSGDYAEGRYEVLKPHSKIVFTWNTSGGCAGQEEPITGTRVTLTFSALGNGKSELMLRHEGFTTEAQSDAHKVGWASSLNDLALATQ